jgi:hypothetical protein
MAAWKAASEYHTYRWWYGRLGVRCLGYSRYLATLRNNCIIAKKD